MSEGQKHPKTGSDRPELPPVCKRGQLILSQRLRKIHRAMLDAENLQPRSGETVENQVIFKIIHTPRTDVLQIPAAKFPEPAFQRLPRQIFHRAVNCLEKATRRFGIVFADILEVAERVQFGGVTD
jgi:hypothetical protein